MKQQFVFLLSSTILLLFPSSSLSSSENIAASPCIERSYSPLANLQALPNVPEKAWPIIELRQTYETVRRRGKHEGEWGAYDAKNFMLEISVSKIPAVRGIKVYKSHNGKNFNVLTFMNAEGGRYVDRSVKSGQTYYYIFSLCNDLSQEYIINDIKTIQIHQILMD